MGFEFFDYIYAFITTFISLTVCFLAYVNYPRMVYSYAIMFLLSNQVSNYFCVIFYLVVGDYPSSYSILANIGWNIGYIFMFLMVMSFKCKEERRYFNPVMFLPIPIDIFYFIWDYSNGGVINNAWQAVACTAISCICIQSILWYIKEKKNESIKPPYVAIAMLIYVACNYFMWTSEKFGFNSGWQNYTTFFSAINYTVIFFLPYIIKKCYGEMQKVDIFSLGDNRFKVVINIVSSFIIALFSIGGYVLGAWMKDILVSFVNKDSVEDAYVLIVAMLFVITIVITIVVIAVVLFVGYSQKMFESNMLKEEKILAEKANSAKSEFLASMSHEIRTPINAVLGMNEMILRESKSVYNSKTEDVESMHGSFGEIINYASSVDNAGNNLLGIVNDILDFSKIEAGELDIIESRYDLGSMINDISNMLVFRAREKNLEFHVEAAEDLPAEVSGDEKRVRQIVTNILTNAVKYTEKGTVKMSVKKGEALSEGRVGIIFVVTDTGIGIKEEDMDKLFVKFRRVDREKNKKVEGTGLGLAITQNLTSLMGGSVKVESEYGKGSTFTIIIPQKPESEGLLGNYREKYEKRNMESNEYREKFRAPSADVLIVDDNRVNIIVLEKLLKKTEVKVDSVLNGKDAIKLADEKKYDVILMDNRMPEMDGSEVLKLIRASRSGKNHETPIVCLTADAVSDARNRYIAEGFSDYMSKPVRGDELERMLIRFIPEDKISYKSE